MKFLIALALFGIVAADVSHLSSQYLPSSVNEHGSEYLPPTNSYGTPAAEYGPPGGLGDDAPAQSYEYLPPASPGLSYLPPTSKAPGYIPPASEGQSYIPPPSGPAYIPPAPEGQSYIPPPSGPAYIPPATPASSYIPPVSQAPQYIPPAPAGPEYIPPEKPTPKYLPPVAPVYEDNSEGYKYRTVKRVIYRHRS